MAEPGAPEEPLFKAAVATGPDWGLVAKNCLDALGEPPAGANFGLLYATGALASDLGSIVTFLRETTGIEHWCGTVGLGVAANGIEYHDQPALALLAAALPADSFNVFADLSEGLGPLAGDRQDWIARRQPTFGIVHGDPRNHQIAEIVEAVAAETTTFLVGGLSAGAEDLPQLAERVTEGGLSGVLFSPSLPVVTGLTQGCTPIAAPRTISDAENNVIKSIDDRTALEVFKEDIGELLARDLSRVGGYIYVGFPIARTDTGDYLVRNITGVDPNQGWLAVGATVEAGQRIVFCRRDHTAAVTDLKRMLADVKNRAGGPPKAAVYVSCVARGPHLFGADSAELRLVGEALGETPLVGFFANGEIFNNRLYGYTGVLTLFL